MTALFCCLGTVLFAGELKIGNVTLSPVDRILVLAPHPDDEVLGAGGVIRLGNFVFFLGARLGMGVAVGRGVTVLVAVAVGVKEGDLVGVTVGELTGTAVGVGMGVGVVMKERI